MKKKEQIEITSDDNIRHKVINSFFSNSHGLGYSSDDFFIDFVQLPPAEGENWADTTRIFLTPKTFKILVQFLKERLNEYEKDFGEIKVEEEKSD